MDAAAAGGNGGQENQNNPNEINPFQNNHPIVMNANDIVIAPWSPWMSLARQEDYRHYFESYSGTLKGDEDDENKNEMSGKDLDWFYDLSNFAESALLEILIRLPVKSLFRYECVCKNWLDLISHPSCSRLYVSSKLKASSGFRLFYRYVYAPEFEEVLRRLKPDVLVSREFSVVFLSSLEEQQMSKQFKVLAVTNGLVMFCSFAPLVYFVCDPVTRQWVSLPRGRQNSSIFQRRYFGEGLVSKVNENNVVTSFRAVRVECQDVESFSMDLEVFASETGVWTAHTLVCPKKIQLLRRGIGPIDFNGIVHWFVHDMMVAFDPYRTDNQCRFIQFPDGCDTKNVEKHDGLYRLCNVSQGKLRYFEIAPEPSELICFKMWVLEDYEKGEWLMEFQVSRNDLFSDDESLSNLLPTATFIPLSFHQFDADVVYMRCVERSCIVTFNFRAKRMDVTCEVDGGVGDLSWRVVIPVVLSMWPAPLPRPRKGVTQAVIDM
nr:PREDICTED: F-box protein At1g49990-like [Daucus carota subsp. sativus]